MRELELLPVKINHLLAQRLSLPIFFNYTHPHIYIFIERELFSSIHLLRLASVTLTEVISNSLSSLLTHTLSSDKIPSLIKS